MDASAKDAEDYIVALENILPRIEELKSEITEQIRLETKASTKRKSKTAK